MKNCYFCHAPLGNVVASLQWSEWALKHLETINEFAHLECLELAQKKFEEAGAARPQAT